MQGQLGLVININFHWLKGTNGTVNHIRAFPQANGIQNEINDGCTSTESRSCSIGCLLEGIFLVISTIDTTEIYYTTDRTTQVDDNSPLSPLLWFHNFT